MKSLFWILALFALAVGVSLAMRFNEGYVLVVAPPYRAEISLNLAVFLAMLGFGVGYALLRAVALASSLPRRIRESRARQRREKAAETFAEGVRRYLAGERRTAIDTLAGLRGESGWTALAAALAARAENELGAVDAQREPPAVAAEPEPPVAIEPPAAIEPDAMIEPEDAQPVQEEQEQTGVAKD
jgi:HemY protein